VRDAVNYEGQAAIELEQAAVDDSRPHPVRAGRSCGPSAGSSVLAAAARIAPDDRRSSGLSRAGYAARVEGGLLYGSDLVGGVVDDMRAGIDVPVIAARFHAGLAGLLARAAVDACATTGLDTVALSGGVFQNVLLLRLLVAELETAGLRVLTHSRVPPNDAGVSLGQVAVAAARDTVG
jgi:hydrogenase maturation protein HypF